MFYARLDIRRCCCACCVYALGSYAVNRLLDLLALNVSELCGGSASDGSLWRKIHLKPASERKQKSERKKKTLKESSSWFFVWIGNYVYFYAQNALMQCILLCCFVPSFRTHYTQAWLRFSQCFRVVSFVCTTEWIVISLMKMLDGK